MLRNKTTLVLELGAKIKPFMGAASDQLSDMVFRAEISDILRRHGSDDLLEILLTDRRAVPCQLIKGYLDALPGPPLLEFRDLEDVSKPLKEIGALLHPLALSGWVRIPDETGCRMKDNRMPLADFRTELGKQLFPEAEGARKN